MKSASDHKGSIPFWDTANLKPTATKHKRRLPTTLTCWFPCDMHIMSINVYQDLCGAPNSGCLIGIFSFCWWWNYFNEGMA